VAGCVRVVGMLCRGSCLPSFHHLNIKISSSPACSREKNLCFKMGMHDLKMYML